MDEVDSFILGVQGIYGIVFLASLIAWIYFCAHGTIHLNVVVEIAIGIGWVVYTLLIAIPWLFGIIGAAGFVTWIILCGNGTAGPLGGFWEIAIAIVWPIYVFCGLAVGRIIND